MTFSWLRILSTSTSRSTPFQTCGCHVRMGWVPQTVANARGKPRTGRQAPPAVTAPPTAVEAVRLFCALDAMTRTLATRLEASVSHVCIRVRTAAEPIVAPRCANGCAPIASHRIASHRIASHRTAPHRAAPHRSFSPAAERKPAGPACRRAACAGTSSPPPARSPMAVPNAGKGQGQGHAVRAACCPGECAAAFYERRGLASAAPPKITPVAVGGVYPPGHGFGHRRS
jgi:hypothetical protein